MLIRSANHSNNGCPPESNQGLRTPPPPPRPQATLSRLWVGQKSLARPLARPKGRIHPHRSAFSPLFVFFFLSFAAFLAFQIIFPGEAPCPPPPPAAGSARAFGARSRPDLAPPLKANPGYTGLVHTVGCLNCMSCTIPRILCRLYCGEREEMIGWRGKKREQKREEK